MLSSSKSSSTDNVPNKKKRKIISPLIPSKSPKVVKLTTKENLIRVIPEKEEDASEKKLNSSNDSIEVITSDNEKKDLDQSDQQKNKKSDDTPKRKFLEKNKKLDRSQKQKPGALTKFLKKADREVEESDISHNDNNLSELKDKKDCQDASVHKEKNEICSNESPKLEYTAQLNETDDHIASKDADLSRQESDCDITILSSDNEVSSELDKSISNINKETEESITLTPKSDKNAKNKTKKLTPKQLEKRQEIARRKEEKLKLKMVCMYSCIYRRSLNYIFIYQINLNYKFDYMYIYYIIYI